MSTSLKNDEENKRIFHNIIKDINEIIRENTLESQVDSSFPSSTNIYNNIGHVPNVMQSSQAMADGGTRKNRENETGVIVPPHRYK